MSESQNTCKDIAPLLDAFHDGELDAGEKKKVETHLANCAVCQTRLGEIGKLVTSLRGLPQLKPARDLADEIPDFGSAASGNKLVVLRPLTWASVAVAAAAVLLFLASKTFHMPGGPAVVADGTQKSKPGATKVEGSSNAVLPEKEIARSEVLKQEEIMRSGGSKENGSESHESTVKPQAANMRQEIAGGPGTSTGARPVAAAKNGATVNLQQKQEENVIAENGTGDSAMRLFGSAEQYNDEAARAGSVEVATLDEVGHSSVTGAIGLATDEDGLYAIKL